MKLVKSNCKIYYRSGNFTITFWIETKYGLNINRVFEPDGIMSLKQINWIKSNMTLVPKWPVSKIYHWPGSRKLYQKWNNINEIS